MRIVLERFKQYGVIIKPSKCDLGVTTLQFLGHQVNSDGIQPLVEKVKAIQDFPQPPTRKKLREFLGLVNFYHRFVQNCATIVQPLNDLLTTSAGNENSVLQWNDDTTVAFETIKQALSKVTLLLFSSQTRCTHKHYDRCIFMCSRGSFATVL